MSPEADLIMSDVAGQQPSAAQHHHEQDLRSAGPLVRAACLTQAAQEWSKPLTNPPVRPSDIQIQAYHQMVNEGVPVQKALSDARDAYNKLLGRDPGTDPSLPRSTAPARGGRRDVPS